MRTSSAAAAAVAAVILPVSILASCSGAGGEDGAGGGGSAQTVGTSGGSPCDLESRPGAPAVQPFSSLAIDVTDAAGAPRERVRVAVCGANGCTAPAYTDAAGRAALSTTPFELDRPRAWVGDGLDWLLVGAPLVLTEGGGGGGGASAGDHAAASKTVALRDSAQPLAPGAQIAFGEVIIEVHQDAGLDFTLATLAGATSNTLRVAELDAIATLAGDETFTGGEPFSQLIGLGPAPVLFCQAGFTLRMPNRTGLLDGEVVDVFAFGFDLLERQGSLGAWSRVGEGRVVGGELLLGFEEPLRILTTLGVRRAQ